MGRRDGRGVDGTNVGCVGSSLLNLQPTYPVKCVAAGRGYIFYFLPLRPSSAAPSLLSFLGYFSCHIFVFHRDWGFFLSFLLYFVVYLFFSMLDIHLTSAIRCKLNTGRPATCTSRPYLPFTPPAPRHPRSPP